MDRFRELQQKNCNVGGLFCECCNRFKTKKGNKHRAKAMLNRIVRSELKDELKKEIKNEL